MTTFMYSHTNLFFIAIFLGGFLTICYNTLEIFRYAIAHKKFFIQIEDFFYWIFCLFFVFHVALSYTKGQIRFFFVFGIALGMVLCKSLISPILLFFSSKIIDVVKKIIALFLEILFTPFRLIFVLFAPIIRNIYAFCEKILRNHLKNLQFYVIMICRKNSITRKIWHQIRVRKKICKRERFGEQKK